MAENLENLDATRVSHLRSRAKRRAFLPYVAGLPSVLKRTFCRATDISFAMFKQKFSILMKSRSAQPPLPFPSKPSVSHPENQTVKLANITKEGMPAKLHYIEVPWIKGPEERAALAQYQAIQRLKNGQSDGK